MSLFNRNYRDQDFFEACERVREGNMSVKEIATRAINTEASSFYLMKKEIVKILYAIVRNNPPQKMNGVKESRYEEIRMRYERLKQTYPAYTLPKIANIILGEKAPRFYITPARATILYYELLKKRNSERFIR